MTRDSERMGRGILAGTGAFHSLGRSIAFASGSFLGAAGFTALVRTSITAASDLNEEINKSRVVFRGSEKDILAWSKSTADGFGIAQHEALGMAATFGNMLVPMGFARDRAEEMSKRMVELAADMASFNNASPEDTLRALQSGLAGQVRPLRQYGVAITQARIQQELANAGIHESAQQITSAQKAWAIYRIILKDTADAQGDFHRTSGGLANQQRILRAQLADLEAEVGKALLPTVLNVTKAITGWLSKSKNQERIQKDVTVAIRDARHAFRDIAAVIHHVDDVTGGFKHTLELLLALKVASVVGGWKRNFASLIGSEAAAGAAGAAGGLRGAAGAAGLLRTRLLALTRLGPIIIPVALSFIPPTKKGQDDLDRAGVGFLGHLPFVGHAEQQVARAGVAAGTAFDHAVGALSPREMDAANKRLLKKVAPTLFRTTRNYEGFQAGLRAFGLSVTPDEYEKLYDAFIGLNDTKVSDETSKPAKTGKASAPGGPPGARPRVTALTDAQQTPLLRAEATKGTADDLAALRTQLGQLGRLLKQPGLKPGELNSLLSAQNDVQGQIDSIIAQNTEKAAERARKAKERIDRATRKRKAAEKARVRAIVTAVTHTESGLKNALEKAKLTDDMSDDVRAARALEAFYRHESHDNRLSRALRDAFAAKDLRERVAIKDMLKGKKSSAAANEREFLSAFQSIVGDFASNYGANPVTKPGTTVEVHQHFQAPTPDRHREARMIRHAAQTAFDA